MVMKKGSRGGCTGEKGGSSGYDDGCCRCRWKMWVVVVVVVVERSGGSGDGYDSCAWWGD